jgi:hypothetical protein
MTSTIKVNNIQNQCGANIIKENSNTITLGASGDTIALASGASQTGFGREGSVNWQTGSIKTSTFTAANGEGYFCNTAGGAFTVNLPAGSAGNIVAISDYNESFSATNKITIDPNGTDKIGGVNENAILNTAGQTAVFVFIDSTEGWVSTSNSTTRISGELQYITASVSGSGNTLSTAPDCGNFKIATFTGPGNFVVCTAACSSIAKVDYLIVAGGAGGGQDRGGAGGAGGYRETYTPAVSGTYTASPLALATSTTVTAQTYPIVIGAGGAGRSSGTAQGGSGGVSSGLGITSAGGGGGGGSSPTSGAAGGSGGGGAGGPSSSGGAGNTPPVSPSQGNAGGAGYSAGNIDSGPGGGAGGAGGNAEPPAASKAGGIGVSTEITGAAVGYAGGGGGGGSGNPGPASPTFGGGSGGGSPATPPGVTGNGVANKGGGGGGSRGTSPVGANGGNGGSGVVIIRFRFQ